MQFQVLVLREIRSKIGSVRVPKGTVLMYDEQTASVIVKISQYTDVYLTARLGKDVTELQWLQVKPRRKRASPRC